MGLESSLLNAFDQIQRCLGVDTLALHANQPHLLKIQGCVDVQALPARRCLDRRPVVLSEPSVRWSGLVLGVHRIDEDPLLVRRQAIHKAFILRNKKSFCAAGSACFGSRSGRFQSKPRRCISLIDPGCEYSIPKVSRSHARAPFVSHGGWSQFLLRGRQMTLTLWILCQIQRCHSLLLEVAPPAAHSVGIQEQNIGNKRRRMALGEEKMRVGSAYFQSFGIVLPEYSLQLRMLADS